MYIDLPFASTMRVDTRSHLWRYASEEVCEWWHLFEQWTESLAKPERDRVEARQGECA
ncbi:MAG TPA: hypothetical protein VFC37_09145 [Terracidiphilus sp.]|jgi:hypothetical protein|nr:hypothetical protein [Terracidiphilus sp.]